MRLTPSSSLLLATLALSSSSSSLAAPTDSDVNGLSTSSSVHGIHSRDSMTFHAGDGNVDLSMEPNHPGPDREQHRLHEKRLDLGAALEGVPILGQAIAPLVPKLEPIFNALGLGDGKSGGPNALLALTPTQVSQVQQAVAQAIMSAGPANVTGVASSLPAPAPPAGVPGNITSNVPVAKRDDYPGGNSTAMNCSETLSSSSVSSTWSPVSTFAAFAVPSGIPPNAPPGPSGLPVSPPTSSTPVGSANPLSPSLPVNPPNTPVSPPFPAAPGPNGSSSFSSAGATSTASPDMMDVVNNTTPPLFMSSTAVANSSSTAYSGSSTAMTDDGSSMATASVNMTSSYPSSTASF